MLDIQPIKMILAPPKYEINLGILKCHFPICNSYNELFSISYLKVLALNYQFNSAQKKDYFGCTNISFADCRYSG
jgi:hypothetical protein